MTSQEIHARSNQRYEKYFANVGSAALEAIRASGESYHRVLMRSIDDANFEGTLREWLHVHYSLDCAKTIVSTQVSTEILPEIPDSIDEVISNFEAYEPREGIATDEGLGIKPAPQMTNQQI